MKKLKTLISNIKFLMLVDLRDRFPEPPIVTFNDFKKSTLNKIITREGINYDNRKL